jgi:hypothetical protein
VPLASRAAWLHGLDAAVQTPKLSVDDRGCGVMRCSRGRLQGAV